MIVGYARVSTDDQDTSSQRQALKSAGCAVVYQDIASGADRNRPELARCIERLKEGDILLVVRLDRIARSLIHLLAIVEDLQKRRIGFRSLSDPFDTNSAQGRLMMQMLGAFAEFERHLIRERTMAGLAIAKAKGKKAGNPRFRARDRASIDLMRAAQADTFIKRAQDASQPWIEMVRQYRPQVAWDTLCRRINDRHHPKPPLNVDRLRRHTKRLVEAGDLPPSVLDRAPNKHASQNLSAAEVAAQIKREKPDCTLLEIAGMLTELGLMPPRASSWSKESIRLLIQRSETPNHQTDLMRWTAPARA